MVSSAIRFRFKTCQTLLPSIAAPDRLAFKIASSRTSGLQAIFTPETLRQQREQVVDGLAIPVAPPVPAVKVQLRFRAGSHSCSAARSWKLEEFSMDAGSTP